MGIGIFIPLDSPMGMILGVIAIIIVAIFIILLITMGISDGIGKIIGYFNNKDRWYHKSNKDNKIALFCSILLPFSGNVYLKESIASLVLTILTILLMAIEIVTALNGGVMSIYNNYTFYLIILWVISLISLGVNILQYNKYKSSYNGDRTTDLDFIDGKKILRVLPAVLLILFLIANIGVINNDNMKNQHESEHLFISSEYPVISQNDKVEVGDNEKLPQDFSLKYPDDYELKDANEKSIKYSISTTFYPIGKGSSGVSVSVDESSASAKSVAEDILNIKFDDGSVIKNIDGGTINVDGHKAYIVKFKDGTCTRVLFKNGNQLYTLQFNNDAQDKKIMDCFIDSFKFI